MPIAATYASVVLAIFVAACGRPHKVIVDTPTHAKLDVSPFQRVLVAGFIGAGTTAFDLNVETVRLLRHELRSKTSLKVIEADTLPLAQIAAQRGPSVAAADYVIDGSRRPEPPKSPSSEKHLDAYRHVFADTILWKRLGEEYQDPLIVTGTLLFTTRRRGGSLQPTFIFIDGRTGTIIHSETFPEERLSVGRRTFPHSRCTSA